MPILPQKETNLCTTCRWLGTEDLHYKPSNFVKRYVARLCAKIINSICNGSDMDRTSSMPKSVLHLRVDKGQGLWSGILNIKGVLDALPKLKECAKNE